MFDLYLLKYNVDVDASHDIPVVLMSVLLLQHRSVTTTARWLSD